MKRSKMNLLKGLGKLSLSIVGVCFLASCSKVLPYQDTSLSPAERAEDLVGRLTLEEKVSLMQHESPAVPRLGIKKYVWWNEALHGVGRAGLATVFPQSIGMAASFNDELLYDVFTAVSDEARAKHNEFKKQGELQIYQGLTFWTPNINIFRDPRWGRGQETYGEDPYLTSKMGVSVVRGLQGPEDAAYDKLHACAKHYAVHSGPEWNRHSFNAEDVDPRDLWETYLPAFKSLVQKADVKEVMCAYNRYEDEPCCGSDRLLQQILRDEWGYDGLVVSDCWAINDFYNKGSHETEPDATHASAKAVITGTDLECGSSFENLVSAVKEGLIDEATIDRSLERLMKARFELGEMDENTPWDELPYSIVDSKEHHALALKMAQETMVLLQNKGNVLPLSKDLTIAVIGPNANDSVMQWGNYNGFPSHTVTLLEGIQRYLPEGKIIIEKGCDYTSVSDFKPDFAATLKNVKKADVILFAGGISPKLEGEEMPVKLPGFRGGDRETIELPEIQTQMMRELKKAGKPLVYVNFSGSAIALEREAQLCDAILQAWYPGQAGGEAIASVLFGDYNPAGRLPVTFYKNTAQLPDFEEYSMKGRTYRYMTEEPLFPFGHGLSYSTFSYGEARLSASKMQKGTTLSLIVPVSNTSQLDGEEVVQLYLRYPEDKEGPVKALRAFKRVAIGKGVTQEVKFDLCEEDFEWFDPSTNTLRSRSGEYEILYGGTSIAGGLKKVKVMCEF